MIHGRETEYNSKMAIQLDYPHLVQIMKEQIVSDLSQLLYRREVTSVLRSGNFVSRLGQHILETITLTRQ